MIQPVSGTEWFSARTVCVLLLYFRQGPVCPDWPQTK